MNKFVFKPKALAAMAFAEECGCVTPPAGLTIPTYLATPENNNFQTGGIMGWVALQCDQSFTDITLQTEWEAFITAGQMFGRYDCQFISGSIPTPDRTTQTLGACAAPITVRKEINATLTDNLNDTDFSLHDLYSFLEQNYRYYQFALIDCNDNIRGFYKNVVVEASEIVPDNNTEVSNFEVNFKFLELARGFQKPVNIPFLADLDLQG